MKLSEEYRRQLRFRAWDSYLRHLNVNMEDTILDLGCSIGEVTRLLAAKARRVIGVDNNPELLEEAGKCTSEPNVEYALLDLSTEAISGLPSADGIWSSYTASYFPAFEPVLQRWVGRLKPGGWIALTEMSDLMGHEPLTPSIREIIRIYYVRQRKNNTYDFEMGSRLKTFMTGCGLTIEHEEDRQDPELTFRGPAGQEVLKSWDCRFDRMTGFQTHLGEEVFGRVREAFLECLAHKDHISHTTIKFIIGRKLQ